MTERAMSDEKQGPWSRLIAAARKAQAVIEADHSHLHAPGGWDDDEAMQAFEDIECALLDIKETGLKTDELPALVEACRVSIMDYAKHVVESYWKNPEHYHVAINRISIAVDKVTQP